MLALPNHLSAYGIYGRLCKFPHFGQGTCVSFRFDSSKFIIFVSVKKNKKKLGNLAYFINATNSKVLNPDGINLVV